MSHKLGICIPYRNRKEHIERLVPHLSKKLTEQGIDHAFYVGHQVDDKLFNRGALLNIGFKYAKKDKCKYVVLHDVDMIPYDVDYSYSEKPLHLASNFIREAAIQGKTFLFVGTKRQAISIIAQEAKRCNSNYINYRWLGGILTNWNTFSTRIKRLKNLER